MQVSSKMTTEELRKQLGKGQFKAFAAIYCKRGRTLPRVINEGYPGSYVQEFNAPAFDAAIIEALKISSDTE